MTAIVIRCDRCGRRYRNPAAFVTDEWNATLRQGVVVGYLCPDCQTPENAEAAIHEATLVLWPRRARASHRMAQRVTAPGAGDECSIPVGVKYQPAQRNC